MAGANVLSPQQEYQIGVQIMNQARSEGAILDDPLVHEYIDNLGHDLSSHSDDPTLHFEYFVLNDPEINAVTLPGGFIGVNSGLILATDNEDELAGVMAHETSHVTQRHIARTVEDQSNRSLLNIATLLGAILVAANSGDPDVAYGAMATAQGAIIQHQITFTRAQEEEADRVGIQTLARAGFPPQGMIEFFQKMMRSSALNGYDYIPEFLLDHPQDATRMAYLMERAEDLHVPPRPNSRSYAIMKARVRVLESNDPENLVAFFNGAIGSRHGWDQDAARYGLALTDSRINRAAEAVKLMQQLCDRYDDVVAFRIGLADAQMAAGDLAAAKATYQRAMQLFPDSLPLTLSYARDLIEANQPRNAINLLISLSVQTNNKPDVLRMLAKAYEHAGNSAESHYYMSEYYYTTGLPAAAADQLHIALATPGIDGMQRQRYQARLERLQAWAKANRQSLKPGNDPNVPGS
ncbi:MAG: M48 family metallopeptidase [Gammaproteobacteria bacterium]|nr:M48 family metallopeptidase [Gammaproteobacteria bacterium]MDE2024825.1 M48 family metallopeptidase [Gammaproteobacteria bacterium]